MSKISRRGFVEGSAASLVVATAPVPLAGQERVASTHAGSEAPPVPHTSIQLAVNGVERRVEVEDRWTLVELLRDHLELTGTKIGCDRGECGACTVLLDGRPVYACSYLAVWTHGRNVRTIEALAEGSALHPLQKAFIDHDGPQCGFCTSGLL